MKKRVLLTLTAAMVAAAMFVSPAMSDMVGLPSMVVSATGNNTTSGNNTETPTNPSTPSAQTPAWTGALSVSTSTGTVLTSTIEMSGVSGLPIAIITPAQTVIAAAGLNPGETLVPTLSDFVGEVAQQMITNTALSAGARVAYMFDITMYAAGRDVADNRVTQLSAPVSFTVGVPDGYDGNVYDFAVVRIHNGVPSILPDLDNDPATVTFASDRFSAYALIYAPKGTLKATAKDSVPKTGDELPVAVPVTATVCLAAVAVTVAALNKKKRA